MTPLHEVETDRNLLFGVLALQLELIDRRQFAEACAAWSIARDRPLSGWLAGRGWITAEGREEVERLLRRKLDRRGGDVRRSLAESVRIVADAGPDDGFRLHDALGSLTGDVAVPAPVTTLVGPTEARRRYVLLHVHAQGGLGRVWVARDPLLGREVALKEIRPDRAGDDSIRARFLREARLTGQLDHPNIVTVHELAPDPAGGPLFYTMRLLRGRRLTDAIREHHTNRAACRPGALEMSGLLNAFVTVCQAIAFAHSRGVIHRDLKGQNILIGDFGEVVVLDWGLAKRLGDPEEGDGAPAGADAPFGEALTADGDILGTPGYMSPEQAEGESLSVGPISDVYGLGAVLYEILTGRAPFGDSGRDEALRRAREEEPPAARLGCPEVPPALEAVCSRAMARRPDDRYASATELAEEVRRWLADEPVRAYAEPPTARLARWARRHRTAVVGASALVLTALVALAAGTVLLGRAYRAEAAERDRKDAYFRMARDFADDLFFGIATDPLLQGPRMDPLRLATSRKARDFYDALAVASPRDAEVRYHLGLAYLRLAPVTLGLRSATQSAEECRHALAIFDALDRDRPDRPDYRRGQAQALYHLGMALSDLSEIAPARAAFSRSRDVALRLSLATRDPADRKALALACEQVAAMTQQERDWAGAAPPFTEALRIWEDLAAAARHRPDAEVRFHLASCLAALGNIYRIQKDERALSTLDRARQQLEILVHEDPRPKAREKLAHVYIKLGKFRADRGDLPGARIDHERARDIWAGLGRDYPDRHEYRWGEAQSLQHLGDLDNPANHHRGDSDRAADCFKRALEIWADECRRNPERPLLQSERARALYSLATLYAAVGRPDDARPYAEQARKTWEALPADARIEYDREIRVRLDRLLADLGSGPAG